MEFESQKTHPQHSQVCQRCSAGISLLPSLPPLPCSHQNLGNSILELHFLPTERCFHQLQGCSIKPAVPKSAAHTAQTSEFCSSIHQIWLSPKWFNGSICTQHSRKADWELLFGIMLPFVHPQLKWPQLDFSMESSGTLSLTSPPSKGLQIIPISWENGTTTGPAYQTRSSHYFVPP